MGPYAVRNSYDLRLAISTSPTSRYVCEQHMPRMDASGWSATAKQPAAFWRHTCARGKHSLPNEVLSSCLSRTAMHLTHLHSSPGQKSSRNWRNVQDSHDLRRIRHVTFASPIWPVQTWNCTRSPPMRGTNP